MIFFSSQTRIERSYPKLGNFHNTRRRFRNQLMSDMNFVKQRKEKEQKQKGRNKESNEMTSKDAKD